MPLPPNIKSFVDSIYALGAKEPESIIQHRTQWRTALASLNRPLCTVGSIKEIINDQVKLRIYNPPGPGPFPLLIYYPGGGFVYSDFDSHEPLCREFCVKSNYVVVNVKTPVAPEYTPHESLQNAYQALLWCIEHAREINSDPHAVIVGGDSSGGNFAALVAIKAVRNALLNVKGQLLIVPATDLARTGESHRRYDQGYLLDRVDGFYNFYLKNRIDPKSPDVSPLYAKIPSNTAPAKIIFATYDPLADDARLYYQHLRQAGVDATLEEVPTIHGMCSFEPVIDTSLYPETAIIPKLIVALNELKQFCIISSQSSLY